MYKILVFSLVLSVAKGSTETVNIVSSEELSKIDDYINGNREKYEKNVKDYDARLEYFRENFGDRLELINLQLNMIKDQIEQNEQRLNSLAVLGDQNNYCISDYRSQIPTIPWTEAAIADCIASANKSLNIMQAAALYIRNNLANYYIKRFETYIEKCKKDFHNFPASHLSQCVIKTVSNINFDVHDNRRSFDFRMKTAECTAKDYINRAVECSYGVHRHIIKLIVETNLSIDKCVAPENKCEPCEPTCPNQLILHGYYKNNTILNPFYGQKEEKNCLLLTVI